jgi:predicted Zn-dependent protease
MRLFLLFLSAAAIFLGGCTTVYNEATGRKEMVVITSDQESAIGRDVNKSILKQFKPSNNIMMARRLENVARRIAAVSDRKDIEYNFQVVESNQINAFAVAGGYVYATTALMKAVESDDELAGVMGHEVGHIAARHPVKRLEASMGYSVLYAVAVAVINPGSEQDIQRVRDIQQIANLTYRMVELGYSRNDEMAADSLALRYTKRAGYNPKAVLTFMEKLLKEESPGSEWFVFMRSHPHTKDRIKAIEKELIESGDL